MAVLNVRVDDSVRDQLKEMADDQGVTLSEFVRDLVSASTVPVYEHPEDHGDLEVPESLRQVDRQMLALLHRILARVLLEDGGGDLEGQLELAEVIQEGYTGEYYRLVADLSPELSRRDSNRVLDILEMFRYITFSIGKLKRDGESVGDDLEASLEFRGFDHNNSLEGHMARYVRFLMDDDRWAELQGQMDRHDRGNSHMPVLDLYLRMLGEYRRIMEGRGRRGYDLDAYYLSLDELQRLADSQIHPSLRREGR
ncbi:YfbU family protein [Microbacter sp. GSS18]|nr:YfbU family protein [Microbacter sp. GSS18]